MTESGQRESKLRQIINYIDYEYVDAMDTDSLLDITIADLLHKLDPHSTYIPQAQVEATEEAMRGSFEGIGIEFKIYKDTLTVVHVLKGGPSERAGLQEGDRILAAGEKLLFGPDLDAGQVVATLKGEAGTRVSLNIYDPIAQEARLVSLKRGEVPVNSVQPGFMLDKKTGFIKLLRFSQNSAKELRAEVRRLKSMGSSKIVLDLRDNPGGLLSAAREISDEFLKKDKLIVVTKSRGGEEEKIFASSQGIFEEGELVILINEGSASASEIVAGAMQDNDRAWVIGRRSFGKGLVQEEMTLEDGSKVRLTTRRYYTPSGRSIQKPFEEYPDAYGDPHKFIRDDSTSEKTYRTSGGRKVYGGGGILPDVRVPIDTSTSAALLYHLSLIANFDERAFAYVDENRKALQEWEEDEFLRSFEVTDTVLHHIFGGHLDRIKAQKEEVLRLIKARIKAYIAYNLFGAAAFQKSYARYDPMIIAALQRLNANDNIIP